MNRIFIKTCNLTSNLEDGNHTHGGQKVFWLACKNGANAEELHFNGEQITGKCIHRWD